MKKYLVIGNPIEHSLSPKLHNYWIAENNINAIYEKKKLDNKDLNDLILGIKKSKIHGLNVTIPFKKDIINYLDKLSNESEKTQSVNTIYLKDNKVYGHNTDIEGFELSIKKTKYDVTNKKVLILGAGGVVPSIIFSLYKMKASKIIVSNRTKDNAISLKNLFKDIIIVDWGEIPDVDMIINATSIGLNKNDELNIDFSKITNDKFFYNIIYNPKETNFLKVSKKLGNRAQNGTMMFIYQAFAAFKIWHGISPLINDKVIKLIEND